jgi:anti-sigma factor RsiW
MMIASRKIVEQEPSKIELLLPWYAAGTLNARDARKVEEALAGDPELARQYAVIREEYAGTIDLNENLGAPSARAMQKLFAAIDAEPARKPGISSGIVARFSAFFSSLSPRTLAWSASLGALVVVLQAGVIAAVLMNSRPSTFQTASLSMNEPITRDRSAAPLLRALVRFTPDARVSDITGLLDKYQASIVDGPKGGMFRLQFANAAMSKDEFAGTLNRLQNEKIVSLAVATP